MKKQIEKIKVIKFQSEKLGLPLNFDWGMYNQSRRVFSVNGGLLESIFRRKFEFDYSNFSVSLTCSDGPKFRALSEIFTWAGR